MKIYYDSQQHLLSLIDVCSNKSHLIGNITNENKAT